MKIAPLVFLLIFLTFLPLAFSGCYELRLVRYNVKVVQDSGEGATLYQARVNGLSNWDGQVCSSCDFVFTRSKAGNKIMHCEFNLGLRKVVPKSGDPYYEMELIHYGDKFIVPEGQDSLAFNVDGQEMLFTKNSDTGGVFYDVTLDQLQEIIKGRLVLVNIRSQDGGVDKAFTWENQRFFDEFIHDPKAEGTPNPQGNYVMQVIRVEDDEDNENKDWGLGRRESPEDKKRRKDSD